MNDAPTPTAKQRMGLLKKLGIGASVALACLVLAILVLSLLAARWEAQVRALSLEEVRGLTAADAGQDVAGDADKLGRSGSQGQGGDQAGAGEAMRLGGGSNDAPDAADGVQRPEPKIPQEMRLAALPTKDQVIGRALVYKYEGLDRITHWAGMLAERAICFAVYEIRHDATDEWTCSIPGQVGRWNFEDGSLETARSWLPEAIRVEKDECWRRYLCADLAWIVDDPQVAVALLEESLSGPLSRTDPEFFEGYAAFNAVDLCVVTGSEELAEYYYLRNRDVLLKRIETNGNCPHFLGTRAWIKNFEGDSDRTSKWWGGWHE